MEGETEYRNRPETETQRHLRRDRERELRAKEFAQSVAQHDDGWSRMLFQWFLSEPTE